MAYDVNFPKDDSYLSEFPAGDREQNRALKDDQIVNAGKLQGLIPSNSTGQIPISNGVENVNLNAAKLNGKTSSDFAAANHQHNIATSSSNGYMSNADKNKLDNIAAGAEVNQNTFSNIRVGSITIQADTKQDTLELIAGPNVVLTPDSSNDRITISFNGKIGEAGSSDSATRASQDALGQQIDLTYIKDVTANNNELTVTKGNNSFSKVTIDGVANATTAKEIVNGVQYCLQSGGGEVDEQGAVEQGTANVVLGSRYCTGFKDLYSEEKPITVAINHRNGNIKTVGSISANSFDGTVTKALQDKNGRDITGYLHKEDNLSMSSSADVVSNGDILTLLNSICTKIKQMQGTDSFLNDSPASVRALLDSLNLKAPLSSPAFSGTPTAPTADAKAGSLGSGIVAANLAANGYAKFGNGLIIQWGTFNSEWSTAYNQTINKLFSFPIAFPSQILRYTEYSAVCRPSRSEDRYYTTISIENGGIRVYRNSISGGLTTSYTFSAQFTLIGK